VTTTTGELSPLKRAILEIRDLKARLAAAEHRVREPIAVIGMGLRFPGGARDADGFWRLLQDGVDAIREVPAARWDAAALYDVDPDTPGRMNTQWGGFLDDIDRFDAGFFGISPREAESMDPQQRLLLEVTWEALEDAGVPPDRLFGSSAGVFVGIANSDYLRLLLADRDRIDTYTTTGNALSIAAGRISYLLGAHGPALSVDTACSSSLVAVHLAVQALHDRECDLALAGGVNLILTPELTINFSRARMMASDGRCKTFAATADGYVRSEGCGVVVLKRLADAEADGDPILALIRGSAVNQDGRSGGLTAPNGPAQERVIAAALAAAGAAANDISYVEAHGTGTLLGDPIEVGALGAALCRSRRRDRPLHVGSVKTNIGHAESAAGIAGLIKVVLMLRHGAIPPHLHLAELNPHIAAAGLPVVVPTRPTAWPAEPSGGRLAGVSSFGLSGTNAHVVIGEWQGSTRTAGAIDAAAAADRPNVVTLSARSGAALHDLAARVAAHLDERADIDVADLAWTTNTARSHFARRLAVVAADRAGVRRQLGAFLAGDTPSDQDDTFVESARPGPPGGLVFLFTGHGSQHPAMGKALYAAEPVFAAAIDRCAALLGGGLDRPLPEILFGDGDLLEQMAYAQPALFSLQYALAELWRSWGVQPDTVAGHSAGEYVAAVVAGVLDLSDGVRLITERGRLLGSVGDDGEMVALFVDEGTVARALPPDDADVGIAAVNGPATTVVSGRRAAVRRLVDRLALGPGDVRPLDVSVAAHSPLVDPILDEFASVAAGVTLRPPEIGLVSSITGEFVVDEVTTPEYWRRHLRAPVRFASVFETLRGAASTTFVEIGPHPTLLGLGRRCWPDAEATWVASMRRGAHEPAQIVTALAAVHAAGHTVDWTGFERRGRDGRPARRRVRLPSYPWQRQSYWSPSARPVPAQSGARRWDAVIDAVGGQAEQGPLDLDVGAYPRRWGVLDRLAGGYIVNAVRDLGLFGRAGERHGGDDLARAGTVAPGHLPLVTRWLGHLADDGRLRRHGNEFTADRALTAIDLGSLLEEAARAFAGIEPLLDYVRRCGERLAAVVSGAESPLALLFPDGSSDTADFIYGRWAIPRYYNAMVRAAVVAAAGSNRATNVIEVGAGTGGTTAAVLPAVAGDHAAYTFTDVSAFFLARAAERFGAYPFVRYALLDIEQPPPAQGFAAGGYDVVVAANVLHATRDLDQTLANVRALLVPGGVLVAYEGTRHPRWFDITTGLIEGWQRFADEWRADVPLLDAHRWAEALGGAGFTDTAAFPGDDEVAATLLHHILVARAPGDPRPRPAAVPDAVDDRDAVSAVMPSAHAVSRSTPPIVAADLHAALATALPDEHHEILVDAVRRAVAAVLRIGDPGGLRRDQVLVELGFDSLMAVELRNVLRVGLELESTLPATLVFDHPTITAIARHLEALLRRAPDASASPAFAPTRGDAPRGRLDPSSVAQLSDADVEAMLLSRLAEVEP
jgi:acyl transferase domain-containing protein/SAM-dependent methyltransferase